MQLLRTELIFYKTVYNGIANIFVNRYACCCISELLRMVSCTSEYCTFLRGCRIEKWHWEKPKAVLWLTNIGNESLRLRLPRQTVSNQNLPLKWGTALSPLTLTYKDPAPPPHSTTNMTFFTSIGRLQIKHRTWKIKCKYLNNIIYEQQQMWKGNIYN